MNKTITTLMRAATTGAILVASLYAASVVLTPAMADPLDAPARASAHADKALLLGLAKAGKRLVAVGERGIVLYSDDDGAHWSQAKVPVSVTLTAVSFPDPQHGYAVGHDGAVIASADGGQHWSKQLDGIALNAMMLAEAQATADKAHAALDGAKDNKAAQAAAERADNALGDVQAANKFGPSRPLLALWFRDANEGWAVGAYGQAIHTSDAGKHWESIAARIANPDGLHFNAVGAGADGALLIAGEAGKVYRSADGGKTWQVSDTGYKGQLYGVVAPAPDALLAFGFGGHLLRSADGGKHWDALPALTGKSLIGALNAADGALLVVARDGTVLRSADQGRSFSVAVRSQDLELASAQLLNVGGTAKLALAGLGGVHLSGAGQ